MSGETSAVAEQVLKSWVGLGVNTLAQTEVIEDGTVTSTAITIVVTTITANVMVTGVTIIIVVVIVIVIIIIIMDFMGASRILSAFYSAAKNALVEAPVGRPTVVLHAPVRLYSSTYPSSVSGHL